MGKCYRSESDKWAKIVAKEGVWADHPEYSVTDWIYEIRQEDTRQGYIRWVHSRIEEDYYD